MAATSSGDGLASSTPNRPSSGQRRSGARRVRPPAIAVDGRADVERARRQPALPPAGAVADDPDPAVGLRPGPQRVQSAPDVAQALLVGHAPASWAAAAASVALAPGA